jgi:hypothetical protein
MKEKGFCLIQSPPAVAAAQFSSSAYGVDGGAAASGYDFSSSSSSQGYSSGGGASGLEGLQVIGGAEAGTYGLDVANGGGAAGGSYSSESYSSSSGYGAEGGLGGGAGFDVGRASFAAADSNHDGGLDQGEFQRFVQGGR